MILILCMKPIIKQSVVEDNVKAILVKDNEVMMAVTNDGNDEKKRDEGFQDVKTDKI